MRIEAKIAASDSKPTVAVHKFTSCDGCQLAFLNMGEALLALTQLVEIRHFAEAGPIDPDAQVDIAFVEGSISTEDEQHRIRHIRANSRYLITIGACATSGGLQALRNFSDVDRWRSAIYASPEYIASLAQASAISELVRVDFQLWGCPISTRQLTAVITALLSGVAPASEMEKVCLECKRVNNVCVMVAQGQPCLGPVTQTGCGAICPKMGRDCYACFGPGENSNTDALARRLEGLGLLDEHIARRFLFINNSAPEFRETGLKRLKKHDE